MISSRSLLLDERKGRCRCNFVYAMLSIENKNINLRNFFPSFFFFFNFLFHNFELGYWEDQKSVKKGKRDKETRKLSATDPREREPGNLTISFLQTSRNPCTYTCTRARMETLISYLLLRKLETWINRGGGRRWCSSIPRGVPATGFPVITPNVLQNNSPSLPPWIED